MTLSITKAHAYGNDFLFAAEDDVRGADLACWRGALCARHTGIGGDGLIVYGFTADGATMRLLNADGSPSELSGNGLRCLAALVMRERERRGGPAAASAEVRADTGAGERRLVLVSRSDGRYRFRAAMGQPRDLQQETLAVAGESLVVATLDIGNPQCVALMAALPEPARVSAAGAGAGHAPAIRRRHQRRVRGRRGARPRAHPDLGARRRPDRGVGHRRLRGGDRGDRVRRRGARRRRRVAGRDPARRVDADGVFLTGWAEILFDATWHQ